MLKQLKRNPTFLVKTIRHFLYNLELFNLLQYWALVIKWEPKTTSEHLQEVAYTDEYCRKYTIQIEY